MIGWKIGTFALELVVWYKPTLYNIELYKLFVQTWQNIHTFFRLEKTQGAWVGETGRGDLEKI